jgi:hypothetical protein
VQANGVILAKTGELFTCVELDIIFTKKNTCIANPGANRELGHDPSLK